VLEIGFITRTGIENTGATVVIKIDIIAATTGDIASDDIIAAISVITTAVTIEGIIDIIINKCA
jgi:hypothetical protein|tara:strand:- start:1179 stop:1370 length:192 start_codon:yes stop_codon:yes gene_type:complete